MKFNIVNPEADTMPLQCGITEERQQELSRRLDAMILGWGSDPVYVPVAFVARDVAALCDTTEEFAYCLILHMGWHQRRGLQLAPR